MEVSKSRAFADLVLVVVGICLYFLVGTITPVRQGFYCNDDAIRFPFHPGVLSDWACYLIVFFTGLALTLLTEVFKRGSSSDRSDLLGFQVYTWVCNSYAIFMDFLISAIFLVLVVTLIQPITGVLSPTFIDQCKPNVDIDHCERYGNRYVVKYQCAQKGNGNNARLSFPSLQAALAAYATVFCIRYIYTKWASREMSYARLLKHVALGLLTVGYILIALNGHIFHFHHLTDILVGYVGGAIYGFYIVRYVMRFATDENQLERQPLLTTFGGSVTNPSASKSSPAFR